MEIPLNIVTSFGIPLVFVNEEFFRHLCSTLRPDVYVIFVKDILVLDINCYWRVKDIDIASTLAIYID